MKPFVPDERGPYARPLRNLVLGVVFVLLVSGWAIGAYVRQGWDFGDALFMTVITVFTVGYDEVLPVGTPALRAITMTLIVLGCTGMIFLTGALVQFITVQSFHEVLGTRRIRSQMKRMDNHTIICGFGRIGRMLARDLAAAASPFVVVEANAARCAEAQADGCLVVAEDATEEAALRHANIERARVLVTVVPDDAANVFITLTARGLNPKLEIIARGEAPATERKLMQAGANHVVLPAHIGADRMAELILFSSTVELIRTPRDMRGLEQGLHRLGVELSFVVVEPGSAHAGRSVAELEHELGCLVLAVEKPASGNAPRPPAGQTIEPGDGVTLMAKTGARPVAHGFSAP